jgi:glycosyltransferase involved in cell wall biosynthesis
MPDNSGIEITVVVTFYKNIECIQFVLESIKSFSEGYRNRLEIILVNDSGDGSKIFFSDQNHFKIVAKNLENNVGVTEARNIGYSNANGKYVLFYDSDDFLISNTLVKVEEFIINNEADVYLFRCIDEMGQIVGEYTSNILYSNTPNLFYGKGERLLCIKKGFKDPFIGFLRGNEHSGLLRLAFNYRPVKFCSSNFPIRMYTNNPNGLSSKIDTLNRTRLMIIGHCINIFYCFLLGEFLFSLRFMFSAIYRLYRLVYIFFKSFKRIILIKESK